MSHRVIQWGTGNVGVHSLRHLVTHPDYELVGLHAFSQNKQGKDAAELAGLEQATSILATNDVEALLALKPDCVVYMANGEFRAQAALEGIRRILGAGINAVSTALIYLVYPPFADPAMREPLQRACYEGGSTLYVNGIAPGFSGYVLPLAGLQMADHNGDYNGGGANGSAMRLINA